MEVEQLSGMFSKVSLQQQEQDMDIDKANDKLFEMKQQQPQDLDFQQYFDDLDLQDIQPVFDDRALQEIFEALENEENMMTSFRATTSRGKSTSSSGKYLKTRVESCRFKPSHVHPRQHLVTY